MNEYQVRDGSRLIQFTGDLLGHVSSQRPTAPRWTEMSLYLTEAGAYILEKVGRSLVCHMPGCHAANTGLPRFQAQHPGEDPDDGWVFHEDCVPMEYDFTALLVERTRYWAVITAEPREILTALERRKGGGVTILPQIGRNLLEAATERYPAFGDFWRTGTVA